LSHLHVEIRDPDATRAPRLDPRFHGGSDVVGVDVAVPQPVFADHRHLVADGLPAPLERLEAVVLCLEEEHHLVAMPVGGGSGHGHRGYKPSPTEPQRTVSTTVGSKLSFSAVPRRPSCRITVRSAGKAPATERP